MLLWLLATLGIALGSAILPVISIEIFLVGLLAKGPHIPCMWLGAAIALGQITGKLVYFYAARGSVRLPAPMRRLMERGTRERPGFGALKQRWQARLEWLRAKCRHHPRWMVGTHAVGSLVGVPPFAATTVLAGVARMPLGTFLATGFSGRFVRFSLIAASPALITAIGH